MQKRRWAYPAAAAACAAAVLLAAAPRLFAADTPAAVKRPAAPVLLAQEGEIIEDTSFKGKIQELWNELQKGGRTMYFLLFLSVMGLAFVLERLFRLRQGVIVPKGLARRADALWREGNLEELISLGTTSRSTLGRIIAFIVKHRSGAVSDVSAGAGDIGARELRRHIQRAYPLAVVATLSPLLGLFGTVIGMIEAFQKFQLPVEGLSDPKMFAGSISKALITTAAGLAIAIPTLGFYHWFKSRTSMYGVILEEQVSDLISDWMIGAKEAGDAD